ncbi:MAG: chromate transporter [Flavobacteriales bacterium]|nr:chromate transporter [Flavobacteriales bacterium]
MSGSKVKKIKRFIFLKDVAVLALTAFGGPSMHIALFERRMVQLKKYLTEEELLELYSLAQMLPGPSSTQTITAMGYKFGGPFLAFLTLMVWVLPAFLLMTACSFLFVFLDQEVTQRVFRFIQPLAVAFVFTAGLNMALKVNKGSLRFVLMGLAFVIVALLRHWLEQYVKTPWMFPVILIGGGVVSYFLGKKDTELVKNEQEIKSKIVVKWRYLVVFALIFVLAGLLVKLGAGQDSGFAHRSFVLFENTYRFGSLVFGGGNVLIPMMFDQFVQYQHWILPEEFLTGIGLNPAVPGPVFTVATYSGGLIMRDFGMHAQIWGCFIATIGIFLPGTLMIFFVYPMWDSIKNYKIIRRSLDGVIAASSGLVLAAGYLLFMPVAFRWKVKNSFHYTNLQDVDFVNYFNIALVILLALMLQKFKIPTPIWVLLCILAGIIF